MQARAHVTILVAAVLAAATVALAAPSAALPTAGRPAQLTAGRPAQLTAGRPAQLTAGPGGVAAGGAAIEDAVTGGLLWSRGLDAERPVASITKVMTAFVVIRAGGLDRTVTIPSAVVEYVEEHDASNAGLWPGDRLTVRQLLYGLLLPSGADAAYTLAEAYGPGLTAFVRKMNATANLLHLTRTHFSNFDGLPYPTGYSTYSTPADLLRLGRAAMAKAAFRSVVDRRSYRLAAGSGHHGYTWKNLNPLLGRYQGTVGIKAGYTGPAGQCLLFEAIRNGYSLVGVTLDGPGSLTTADTADAIRMLNWAFSRRG